MRQKKTLQIGAIILIFVLATMMVGCLAWSKMDGIYSRLNNLKTSISRENESASMHEELVDVSNLTSLEDEPEAWYTQYHFISHSGQTVRKLPTWV